MQVLASIDINAQTQHEYTIICLHGLGASGDDLAPLAQELQCPNVRWVFPHAPQRSITINGGMMMRAWHDRLNFKDNIPVDQLSSQLDLQGVDQSDQLIRLLIEKEARMIAYDKIIIMGFSQGGAMAVHTGTHFPKTLAGIVGLSCYPAMAQLSFDNLSTHNQKTPIFLGHGSQDDIVKLQYGKALYQGLCQRNYAVTWQEYPMAHSICAQELQDVNAWLKQIF